MGGWGDGRDAGTLHHGCSTTNVPAPPVVGTPAPPGEQLPAAVFAAAAAAPCRSFAEDVAAALYQLQGAACRMPLTLQQPHIPSAAGLPVQLDVIVCHPQKVLGALLHVRYGAARQFGTCAHMSACVRGAHRCWRQLWACSMCTPHTVAVLPAPLLPTCGSTQPLPALPPAGVDAPPCWTGAWVAFRRSR